MEGNWRRWRPISWFIVTVNLIFPLWVLHGLQIASTMSCARYVYNNCVTTSQSASSPLIPMLVMWLFSTSSC